MATKIIESTKNLNVELRINDDFSVELIDFSCLGHSANMIPETPAGYDPFCALVQVQCTGESSSMMHGNKHNASSSAMTLKYDEREEYQNNLGRKLEIKMTSDNGLQVVYHMQFFNEIDIVRTWSVLTNVSNSDIGIEYVSSFIYQGMCKNGTKPYYEKVDVFLPLSSWLCEAQWKKYDIEDIGLNRMVLNGYNAPSFGINRYSYGSGNSWSSCEVLPMGIMRDRETSETYFWQIESSGAWLAEYGSCPGNRIYAALSGATENEHHWWKNLKPGSSFTTVSAGFGAVIGDESTAIAELTKYRRAIRRLNEDNEKCNVIFNDYMNCLNGDPTEEKEYKIIDKAAELGCEYYCLDAGWYDKGSWWDRVGEWKESPERFPSGLVKVFDYARSKGMKTGLWLEIEVMGTACKLANELPDNWFFVRHGKRHIDNKRYLLDFRNPDVRDYCSKVIDRMIEDYGVEFFKIDYNVTTSFGSDLSADSCGDALLEHTRALYSWYDSLYAKYPHIIIENCGSGGQRMDYGMLSRQSLQSTSDQTDYLYNSYIAANVASAVTPEQAGMWVYPYEDNAEHIIYNMVNGMLLRPYVSGLVWNISKENLDLLARGITVYKSIRADLKRGLPFFPLGFGDIKDDILAYGLECKGKAYLSVFGVRDSKLSIPLHLKKSVKSVKCIYPPTENCKYELSGDVLNIILPQEKCARFFELIY